MKRAFKRPWYPILAAAYPVLAGLAYNLPQIRYTAGLRPLLLSLAGAAVLWSLLCLAYRDLHRAAAVSAAILVLFFTYGHVYDLIGERWKVPHLTAAMLALWSLLAGLALARLGRDPVRVRNAAPALNLVCLGLVLFSSAQVIWWSIPQEPAGPVDDHAPLQTLQIPEGQAPPDIYYIIVDSYGRSDLLDSAFDLDNRGFIASLQEMGFYVADCAQSNYNRTDVSLASSLNMNYLQELDDDYRPGNTSRRTLWDSISHSTVRSELERLGYRIVAFSTGFAWTELDDADVYFSPAPLWSVMTGFETMLIRTTPPRYLEDLGWMNLDEIDGRRYRERTQLILASMDDLAHMPGPKFVFIHIVPPHPPFVYGPDGRPTDPAPFLNENRRYTYASYTEGYRNQVQYISSRIQAALSTLLDESGGSPIVILQGDHAPWLQSGAGRFKILSAYYLPGHADLPYRTISPVNSFRLVFDAYFGAHYDILPDLSYYSPVPNIYEFQETPNPCLEP